MIQRSIPEPRGTGGQLETDAAANDHNTPSSLVAHLLTACGARLTAGLCILVERTTCDACGNSAIFLAPSLERSVRFVSMRNDRKSEACLIHACRILGRRAKSDWKQGTKGPQALTNLVVEARNGYIGFRAKIVRFAKVAAVSRTQ
jgi:hypothetical protein